MGIRGLKSLLERDSSLFEPYKLHDCPVVIDGNNLCHRIYTRMAYPTWQFGGEYEAFHTEIVKFFQMLKDCGVVPYVLFDGAQNRGERRLRVVLDRAQQRLDKAMNLMKPYLGKKDTSDVLPLLAMDIFRSTVQELGIAFARNIYEADGQSASVANRLNCPVMSMDSDFYLLNINAGFINLGTLRSNVCEDSEEPGNCGRRIKYLNCKIYYVARLIQSCPGFQPSMLPMIPMMLSMYGRDSEFDPWIFQRRVDLRWNNCIPKIMSKIQPAGSLEQAMEVALSMVRPQHRDSVRIIFNEIVEEYTVPNLILAKELHLEEDGASADKDRCNVLTEDGVLLPKWFVDTCCSGDIAPFSLNVAIHHRTVLLAQVEDFGKDNSYVISRFLRRVMYGMLLPSFQNTKNKVLEIGYKSAQVLHTGVDPLYQFMPRYIGAGQVVVPSLTCLYQQDAETKLRFMANVFSVRDLGSLRHTLPPEWQLYICILIYFLQNAEPKVTPHYLSALLLTAIYFNLLPREQSDNGGDQSSTEHSSEEPESIEVALSLLRNGSSNGLKHLSRYNDMKMTGRHSIEVRFLHVGCQFQTCLSYGSYLNELLGQPLSYLLVHKFFCGSFLYNLILAMSQKDQEELKRFLEDLLGKESLLYWLYNKLQSVIFERIPQHRHPLNNIIPHCRKNGKRFVRNWKAAPY